MLIPPKKNIAETINRNSQNFADLLNKIIIKV